MIRSYTFEPDTGLKISKTAVRAGGQKNLVWTDIGYIQRLDQQCSGDISYRGLQQDE